MKFLIVFSVLALSAFHSEASPFLSGHFGGGKSSSGSEASAGSGSFSGSSGAGSSGSAHGSSGGGGLGGLGSILAYVI